MYVKRHLEEQVRYASKYYPAVMVCGQRQVGKSTMLHTIKVSERKYVTMDDANARRLAQTDSALFLETYGSPLLIDEFQRAPSVLLEMKKVIDAKTLAGEDTNGMYWLTGSQKFNMMKDVSESLAGRVAVLDMSSFSAAEIEERAVPLFKPDINSLRERFKTANPKNIHEMYGMIFRGGMPKLSTTDIDRDRFYADYINTYLERDIRQFSQVEKLDEFYDFLVFIAARTAQELKYDDISKALGISAPTAKRWVSLLEASGLIFILHPYYSNVSSRLVKTPKIYFMDTGLAAYLTRWNTPEVLENGAMNSAFFETYAVSEIVKSYWNAGKPADLYYYRDIDKKEIDLLIIEGNKIYPIEIKRSKNPAAPDKNFSVLDKLGFEVQTGIILCMSDEIIPYNKEVWYCPAWVL